MADDVTLPGTGAVVATDEVDLGSGSAHVQMVKLVDGTDGGTDRIEGSAARGLSVDPRPLVSFVTATGLAISTSAYAAKDAVGGLLTFANAVRDTGGTGRIESLVLVDLASNFAELDLLLFDRSPVADGTSTVTDNAVFDPVDNDLGFFIGHVPISRADYADLNDNAVASIPGIGLPIRCEATSLFGVLVARDTPTYASTGDLALTLAIAQD